MSTKTNTTHENKDEVIEIEIYTKEGRELPKRKRYKIRIDKDKYIVNTDEMSGRELLELANKIPFDQYAIFQRLKGGQTQKIEFDEVVNFRTPGVERFMTLPLDQTEG